MNSTKQPTVGVIGLGRMGSALAQALLSRKFQVVVWNRSRERTDVLAKAGAVAAETVADAARQANLLIVCLFDSKAVEQAVLRSEVGEALCGKTLVEMTTLNSDELQSEQDWANRHDVAFLKGSILGYPDDVRGGQCIVLYGGAKAAFVAFQPVLQAFGANAVHTSESLRDARGISAAYHCFLYSVLVGLLHGAAVCHRKRVSTDSFARDLVLPLFSPSAVRGMLVELAQRSQSRQYGGDIQASLNAWNDGLGSLIHDLKSDQMHPGLLNAVRAVLDQAVAQGHGESDLAVAFEVLIGPSERA